MGPIGGNHESEATALPRGGVGWKPETNHSTERTVKLLLGWSGLGEYAFQYDARYPIEAGWVEETGAVGHCVTLPLEISTCPHMG